MTNGNDGWRKDPELVEQIMPLWNAGKSQQQIADILGGELTRNKVGGIIHRNRHLSSRAMRAPVGNPKPRVRKPRKASSRSRSPEEMNTLKRDSFKTEHPEYYTAPANSLDYLFAQIEAVRTVRQGQCRFPIGLPDTFCFCRKPHTRGWYCEEHAARVYRGLGGYNAAKEFTRKGWKNRRGKLSVFGTMQKRGGSW